MSSRAVPGGAFLSSARNPIIGDRMPTSKGSANRNLKVTLTEWFALAPKLASDYRHNCDSRGSDPEPSTLIRRAVTLPSSRTPFAFNRL